jgi:hypothetical protein
MKQSMLSLVIIIYADISDVKLQESVVGVANYGSAYVNGTDFRFAIVSNVYVVNTYLSTL